jgi:spermidine/putrescine transport system substrate-binding protein
LQTSAAAISGLALSNCRRGIPETQTTQTTTDTAAAADSPNTLHIYTWADYTDEALASLFTERTGIEVVVDIYDSNETMLAKMQAGGGDAYSIIYPSDYMVEQMIEEGMLMELDKSKLQGLDNLYPQWQDPSYDPGNTHSVPMSWGTTGLLYNSELLETPPEDWNYLWENQDLLARRITLLDDVREVMGAVLRSLGYSYNSTDPAELEEAYQRLIELKPAIASFQSFGWEDQILSGDLLMVMTYSVDAIAATYEDPALNYIVPSSGSSLWTDTMVIPVGAPNPEAAYQWMNLMYEPEVSAEVVSRLFFATPIKAAFEQLPDDLKTNEDLFPPEDVLAQCEGIAPVGDALELYDRYWTEVTSA